MEGQSGDCPDVDSYRETDPGGHAAMEGQSGDCPDADGVHVATRLVVCAAMEGQSGDCPDQRRGQLRGVGHGAAMEGQSGDCPDFCTPSRWSSWHSVPQWRGSRETARTSTVLIRRIDFRGRNGGAVGRLPGPRFTIPPSASSSMPQWRGSRETARTLEVEFLSWRPRCRNGGAVGRLPGRYHPGRSWSP